MRKEINNIEKADFYKAMAAYLKLENAALAYSKLERDLQHFKAMYQQARLEKEEVVESLANRYLEGNEDINKYTFGPNETLVLLENDADGDSSED